MIGCGSNGSIRVLPAQCSRGIGDMFGGVPTVSKPGLRGII
jgi:hypothetical protein